MALPNSLTIWEAQFGDFSNGAQIMIDQFISSAEDKWKTYNGLVMLLPHGYEGQGAEHSSARMERYLQMCAKHNMQMVNCTTPANFFHVIRRQLRRDFRKPLVVFTPKSLLRHPLCVSSLEDLSTGRFQELIDDLQVKSSEVEKVIFCSGKIYYELLQEREKIGRMDLALVRLEQLYPLPEEQINKVLEKYKGKPLIWVQEEPKNMGAWFSVRDYIQWTLDTLKANNNKISYIGRSPDATPATGYAKRHNSQQQEIINKVFD
jgi:2-oxoglutarate dehydrogenase E1 component